MTQLVISQVLNGLIIGSLYGIIALGLTLTFGITGIVNFALGAFMMVGGYLAWWFCEVAHLSYPVAVICAVACVGILGLIADQGLFRFTRNNLVNGLLVSVGLISIIEASTLLLWTSTPKEMAFVLPGAVQVAGVALPKMKLVVFAVLLVTIAATYLGMTRTWIGRAAFAYSQNPEAAQLMGVRTNMLQTLVVVYSTMLAGLGGALYAGIYSLEPSMGGIVILKAVESAILAGIGSVIGALAGGAILGVTESAGSIFLPLAFRDAYGLVFLVAILLVKPSGLFGSK
jgi:branched-chain amino acid transport system permease protein